MNMINLQPPIDCIMLNKAVGFIVTIKCSRRNSSANKRYSMLSRKHLAIFTYFCGTSIFFIIFGVLSICLWSVLYEAILKSQLVLQPGSTAYEVWVKNPVPLSLRLHVFNWTNPEDIYNSSTKPRFQELGPYVYMETKEKINITWNANNETVTYKNVKTWWFDQEQSNGSVYDPFTTINPIALSSAFAARSWHYLVKKGLSVSLTTMLNSIAITKPVGDVLFSGYEDPLLNMAAKLPFLSQKGLPFMDKFGWFYGRNGSGEFEGIFNIDTGKSSRLGVLERWKYATHTPYYPDHCGNVQGASAGDFFPKKLTKESIIKLFSSDLCRFMELEFEKEVVIGGIIGYKYAAGKRFLDNGTEIPENKCFCDGDCMPSGALNVSNCRHGSPAFVSLPHFHKADPYYLNSIEGVHPSEEKSDFFMVFEPNIGIPLQVAARLQLNLRLQSIDGISLYRNVPTVFFPVLYFEQMVTMPDSVLFSLKMLVNFRTICLAVGTICIFLGVLVFGCVGYKICSTNVFGKTKLKPKTTEAKEREIVPLTHGKAGHLN
ncbi:hypothetical protein JTB14_028237 [Gonioctena quinquepunctata]|nr:hypothetical protein JTB14_028237 [Gonioctena quinquepunctata]